MVIVIMLDVARAITARAHGQTGAEGPGPPSAQRRAAATADACFDVCVVYVAWPELLFIIYLSSPG